jgi:hypothetical protein
MSNVRVISAACNPAWHVLSRSGHEDNDLREGWTDPRPDLDWKLTMKIQQTKIRAGQTTVEWMVL